MPWDPEDPDLSVQEHPDLYESGTGGLGTLELHALVRDAGSELWLAQRIAEERRALGWSQSELARRMNWAGLPQFNQTAVSEIEAGVAEGKLRRRIRVDEAIAFSTVFDIPLPALLLPPAIVEHHQALRDIRQGTGKAIDAARVKWEYEQVVDRVARGLRDSSEVAAAYEAARDTAEKAAAKNSLPADSVATQFFRDVDGRLAALRGEQS